MVYDYEYPDIPFDYWESQAAKPHVGVVLGPVPRPRPQRYNHVRILPSGARVLADSV